MNFLNEVEKKEKEEKKEEDPIAMLDDLLEEDKASRDAEAHTTDSAPVEANGASSPRDLVYMLEKLQKLIEVCKC